MPADEGEPAGSGRHRKDGDGPERRRHSRSWLIGGRVVAVFAAVAVLATCAIGWSFDVRGTSNAVAAAGDVGVVPLPSRTTEPAAGTTAATTSAAPQLPTLDTAENILVAGADSRTDAQGNPLTAAQQKLIGAPLDGGGVNTDVLMIVHIPAGGKQATVISIPRDTWMGPAIVDAPGVTGPDQHDNQVHYLPGKINGFYGTAKYYYSQYLASKGVSGAEMERESDEAGRTMLIKIIQQFTGVKIDHYAEVNLLGFYLVSEAVGGVPVCLNNAVDDPWSGADFHKGVQDVQGASALAFVRQRHGLPGGDLDRIKRQQAFIGSAANKIFSLGTLTSPTKLAALLDAVNKSIVLDSGLDLFTFAEQMRGLTSGDIHFATIPTTVATDITTTDALQADPAQVRALFLAVSEDRPLPPAAAATSPGAKTPATTTPATTTPAAGSATVKAPAGSHAATPTPTSAATSGGYQVPCVN